MGNDYSALVGEEDVNAPTKEPIDLLEADGETDIVAPLVDETDEAEEEEADDVFYMKQILEDQYPDGDIPS
ncbi:MAG TPA: hypothetical protein VLB02_01575 [Candidatus Paceibacterota bacterium]|nr:hypothetical protein [Candidatus Paceibacterota bacterium]